MSSYLVNNVIENYTCIPTSERVDTILTIISTLVQVIVLFIFVWVNRFDEGSKFSLNSYVLFCGHWTLTLSMFLCFATYGCYLPYYFNS